MLLEQLVDFHFKQQLYGDRGTKKGEGGQMQCQEDSGLKREGKAT